MTETRRRTPTTQQFLNSQLPPEGWEIYAAGTYTKGLTKGMTVLALGDPQDNSTGWSKKQPQLFVAIPGDGFKPGQTITEFPRGTRLLTEVFSKPRKK